MQFQTDSITIRNRATFVANLAKINGTESRCFDDQTAFSARREGSNVHLDIFAPASADHDQISHELSKIGPNSHLKIDDLGHLWSINTGVK